MSLSLGGRRILDDLTFRAEPGAITALLGPNGAGKSTTIRCCTGLLPVDAGAIRVFGEAPGSPQARARVGVMPQSTGAWSGISPRSLLSYLGRLYAHPQPLDALADEFDLRAFWDTPYRRLSGGQQQLVNLAGALVGRPSFVFLDEPTAGMDPHVRHRTWGVLERLRTAGVGVLLTTHAMDEAQRLADEVALIDAGRVVLAGTTAELTRAASLEEVFLAHTHGGRA